MVRFEDETARPRIGVEREVGEALELVALLGFAPASDGSHLAVTTSSEWGLRTVWKSFRVARLRHGEEPVVEAHLGVNRMGGADPVDGALDLRAAFTPPCLLSRSRCSAVR